MDILDRRLHGLKRIVASLGMAGRSARCQQCEQHHRDDETGTVHLSAPCEDHKLHLLAHDIEPDGRRICRRAIDATKDAIASFLLRTTVRNDAGAFMAPLSGND
jgi:hypothetical protein